LDRVLFGQAIQSLLQALLSYCKPQTSLRIRSYLDGNVVHLEIAVRGVQVSEDDIEHFFYPFTTRVDSLKQLDLPIAKMIIHKHRGIIDLRRRGNDQLLLDISLPQ
jgi:nitrogen-specific signal transduction histidine kinase